MKRHVRRGKAALELERRTSCIRVLLAMTFLWATTSAVADEECDPATMKVLVADKSDLLSNYQYDLLEKAMTSDEKGQRAGGQHGAASGSASVEQRRRAEHVLQMSVGITDAEWRDFTLWYWSPAALTAYQACLEHRFPGEGLHARVLHVDATQVVVQLWYVKSVDGPPTMAPTIQALHGATPPAGLPQLSAAAGASTTRQPIVFARQCGQPFTVAFKAANYFTEPIVVPKYLRIVPTNATSNFSAGPVRAYCPAGGKQMVRTCFPAEGTGRFLSVAGAEISRNVDFSGKNPSVAQRLKPTLENDGSHLCVEAQCSPLTAKGSEIVGSVSAKVSTTTYAIEKEDCDCR